MTDQGDGDILHIASVGRRQLVLLLLGILVIFADGFDSQMAGLVAPAMAAAWHVKSAAFASAFAANVAGLMIGSMSITVLADIFGRKWITTACVAGFGVTSLLTVGVTTIGALAAIRFVSGLLLGGAMPCMIAATSDYFPARYRTRLAVLLTTSWSLGITACGLSTALLVRNHGWQSLYLLGAVLPVVLTPALMVLLPESPAFLIRRGRHERLAAILARIVPGHVYEPPSMPVPQRMRSPVAALFAGRLAWVTPALWLAYFAAGATIYFFLNWLPIFIAGAGYTPAQAASVTAIYQLGGMAGGIAISVLIDRGGPLSLAGSTLLAAVAVTILATTVHSLTLLAIFAALAGAAIVGSQNSANAYAGTKLYPSEIRATGLGWALGWVRLSGVLAGSLGGGFLIGLDLSPANTLRIIAIPEVFAALGYLGVHLALRRGASGLAEPRPATYQETC